MIYQKLPLIISLTLLVSSCSSVEPTPNKNEIFEKKGNILSLIDKPTLDLTLENKKKQENLKDNRREMLVFFSYDKDIIKKNAYKMLDAHADYLLKHKNLSVVLEGNADEKGSYKYNYNLSLARANKVKEYLIKKKVKKEQLIVKAQSKNKYLDYTQTPKGDSINRRVEIIY